jgi:hypothetical protein
VLTSRGSAERPGAILTPTAHGVEQEWSLSNRSLARSSGRGTSMGTSKLPVESSKDAVTESRTR